jgi:hypothetical protein
MVADTGAGRGTSSGTVPGTLLSHCYLKNGMTAPGWIGARPYIVLMR